MIKKKKKTICSTFFYIQKKKKTFRGREKSANPTLQKKMNILNSQIQVPDIKDHKRELGNLNSNQSAIY